MNVLLHLLGDKVKELINPSSVTSYKFKKEETVQSCKESGTPGFQSQLCQVDVA